LFRSLAATADVGKLSPAAVVLLAEAVGGEDGVALLRRARFEHRSDFWVCFTLGNLLNTKKDLAGAEEAFWAALAARPDSLMALNNLGTVLLDRKDLAGAEKALRTALRLDPAFAKAHLNLGIVLHDLKDLAGAEAA